MALLIFFIAYSFMPIAAGVVGIIKHNETRLIFVKYLAIYIALELVFIYGYLYTAVHYFAACVGGCSDGYSKGVFYDATMYVSFALALASPLVFLYLMKNLHDQQKP